MGADAPDGADAMHGSSAVYDGGVGTGSSAAAGGATGSSVATTKPRRTCLQSGIRKPKVYTDGTVRYGCFTSSEEPHNVDEALANKNWKHAMDLEYNALLQNKT
jgi:hypothetical protein